jgi:pimeloyl-ACP methyl ester carboxylesterase
MPVVGLAAGPIEYQDVGAGPAVVLVHGLAMDGAQWRHVVADLRSDFGCILPTLPMGAHRRPMRSDADLSLRGMGRQLADFIAALDLQRVTLSFNDWCGAQVMIAGGLMNRVERLVHVSCEAFDNYPPGLPGRMAALTAQVPGATAVLAHALRVRRLRRLPSAFGRLSKRGVPDGVVDVGRPGAQPDVQHLAAVGAGGEDRVIAADPRVAERRALLGAAEGLADERVDIDDEALGARARAGPPRALDRRGQDAVELADMPERERAQERAQRRGRHHAMPDDVGGAARPQHVAVVDAIGAQRHRRHQRHHLGALVARAGPIAQIDGIVDDRLKPKPPGKRGDQRRAGMRDRALIIEADLDAVRSGRPVMLHQEGDLLRGPRVPSHPEKALLRRSFFARTGQTKPPQRWIEV